MEIEIRAAIHGDLAAMERVGDKLFDYPVKPNRAKEFLDDPRHHLFIAIHEEKIVGMASGFHYVHPDKDPELFVNEVAVLEEYQNKGIARELVRRLCQYGRSIGCRSAWVATEHRNLPARAAFVAAGGQEHPEAVALIEYKW